ncbi:MAG: cytochrome P450 [Labilithrix sp.]|nr:cytochrome P450 [Labilithrix sp.]
MTAATVEPTPRAARTLPRIPGRPILGHLASFRNDRVGMLLRLAKTHPDIVEMPMGLVRRVVVVSSPSLANEVLSTKQSAFVKAPGLAVFLRPVLGGGLLTSEHEVHERQRKLLAPAFAHKRIASYAATMAERAERFATTLREGEPLDLAEAMMRLTFEIVGKTLFDAEVVSDASAVGDALTTAMEVAMGQLGAVIPLPPMIPSPQNLKYKRAVARLDEVVYRIIRERRAEGGDRGDVLSMLLDARDEDGTAMTDRQVRDEAMTLFLAGHETTANALSWTFYLLARHPDARARMEAELDALGRVPSYEDLKQLPYTLAVFKEAMRLYPPAYVLGRRSVADATIGEHLVRKSSIVLVSILGIHRRSDLWPDPETFDPGRFLGDKEKQLPRCAYMPFGAGPRVCIGNHFALMEGHALLATVARRVRFEPTSAEPAELEPLVTLRPKGGLAMRAHVRT